MTDQKHTIILTDDQIAWLQVIVEHTDVDDVEDIRTIEAITTGLEVAREQRVYRVGVAAVVTVMAANLEEAKSRAREELRDGSLTDWTIQTVEELTTP